MTQIKSFSAFLWEVFRDEKRAFKLGHYLAKRHKKQAEGIGEKRPTIMHRDYNDADDEHLFHRAVAQLAFGNWAERMKLNDESEVAKHAPKKKVPVKDLHSTQEGTHFDSANAAWKFKDTDPILVAHHGGKHFIINGHHRVMAHKLRGQSHIDAHVVDLDKK